MRSEKRHWPEEMFREMFRASDWPEEMFSASDWPEEMFGASDWLCVDGRTCKACWEYELCGGALNPFCLTTLTAFCDWSVSPSSLLLCFLWLNLCNVIGSSPLKKTAMRPTNLPACSSSSSSLPLWWFFLFLPLSSSSFNWLLLLSSDSLREERPRWVGLHEEAPEEEALKEEAPPSWPLLLSSDWL